VSRRSANLTNPVNLTCVATHSSGAPLALGRLIHGLAGPGNPMPLLALTRREFEWKISAKRILWGTIVHTIIRGTQIFQDH
jgi:hypothetical protein